MNTSSKNIYFLINIIWTLVPRCEGLVSRVHTIWKHSQSSSLWPYMGVPRKMRESHWGTYFICPFRWRGFLGGSRMSSKMVSLHFPENNDGEEENVAGDSWRNEKSLWSGSKVYRLQQPTIQPTSSVCKGRRAKCSDRWRSGKPAALCLPLRSWQSCCTGWGRCCILGLCPSSPPLPLALMDTRAEVSIYVKFIAAF